MYHSLSAGLRHPVTLVRTYHAKCQPLPETMLTLDETRCRLNYSRPVAVTRQTPYMIYDAGETISRLVEQRLLAHRHITLATSPRQSRMIIYNLLHSILLVNVCSQQEFKT